jgi:hypothetical protein
MLLLIATSPGHGQATIERILGAGDAVPSLDPDAFLFGIEARFVLNNNGEVALQAGLRDAAGKSLNFHGVLGGRPGDLQVFEYRGVQLYPNLSDSGEALLVAQSLSFDSRKDEGLLFGFPGTVELLGEEGMPAPGTDTAFSSSFDSLVNKNGTPAFSYRLEDDSFASFIGRPGAIALVARSNQPAPGLASGVTFVFPGSLGGFNDAGAIVTVASVEGPGITSDNDEGIWMGSVGTIRRVLAEGDPAPGAGTGVVFGNFFDAHSADLRLNNAGQIVFANRLAGAGLPGLDDSVYAGTPSTLQLVARNGMSASGHTFLGLVDARGTPMINRTGQVLFSAYVERVGAHGADGYLQSIWRWTPGTNGGARQLIARAGQQAPGLPAGVLFGSSDYGQPFFGYTFNGAGQVAFFSYITGPGINDAAGNNRALFLTTPSGEVKLIARLGDSLDVGGGAMKKLRNFYVSGFLSGGEDGHARGLSERGELLFTAQVEGSSEYDLYRARVAPPSSLANISTRMRVETGDNALIAGFIITGSQPKKVIIRGIGPSLPFGGVLANPTLNLDNGAATNDDWRSNQEQEIIATTIPPSNNLESAIVVTLNPGPHTAILRGSGNATGIGIVEVYDLESGSPVQLANISSRGLVQSGDDVMIGGFIIGGDYPVRILLRAIGPSLPFSGVLADPTLELVDQNGARTSNDNWRATQEAEITATTIPPSNDKEAAILVTLAPGNYTAIVRGADDTTGIAVVEAYNLQ